MKKFLAMLLALVMALSLVACGEQKQPDADPNEGGDTATGSVYYLNFKPESDAAWQTLAAPTPLRPVYPSRSSPPPPASTTPP